MKKRTKKGLSFGVAALMAVTSLPFSALSVSATIDLEKQTANGGTAYDFVLSEAGDSSVQTINVSSEDVAAGNVTKSLDVYIDSEEWDATNYINSVTLNWCTTKGSTFADGGEIDNSFYYENVFQANSVDAAASVKTLPDGNTVTTNRQIYSLAAVTNKRGKYLYNDSKCTTTVREIACDRIFGSTIYVVDDSHVAFQYQYYDNATDYKTDAAGYKADTNYKPQYKKTKTQVCEVLTNDEGVPYITYDYITQGTDKDENYQTATMTMTLPCYSTTRTISSNYTDLETGESKTVQCVPDINSYYYWGFQSSSAGNTERTSFLCGDSMATKFTSFDVVIPQGTEDGTYYVQLCSRDQDKNLIPLQEASDFDTVKAQMQARVDSGLAIEDMSTCIQGKSAASSYSLPQDASKAVVKIVVGDGESTTAATTTTADATTTTTDATTTTDEPSGDGIVWKLEDKVVNPGDETTYAVQIENAVAAAGVQGSIKISDALKELLAEWPYETNYDSDGNPIKDADGNYTYTVDNSDVDSMNSVYAALSNQVMNMNSLLTEGIGRIDFCLEGQDAVTPSATSGSIVDIHILIPDEATVKSIATKYGIKLQTDADGNSYYEFPVEWNPGSDVGDSGGTDVTRDRFSYLDGASNQMMDEVTLEAGSIKVMVDEEPVTDGVEWNLEKKTVKPGDETTYAVQIENAVAAAGVQGSIKISDALKELLAEWPYETNYDSDGNPIKDADGNYTYTVDNSDVDSMNSVYAALSNQVMNMNSLLTEGIGRIDFCLEGQDAVTPSATSGSIVDIHILIPDEATVKSIAEKYGISLETDEDGQSYYEFPVEWNPGTDIGDSNGTDVVRDRFSYLDGASNQMMDDVTLNAGYIRVVVSADATTTTTDATTTTTEETTTTAATTTTEKATTTTEEATTTTAATTTTVATTTTEEATTTTVATTTAATTTTKATLPADKTVWSLEKKTVKPGDGMTDDLTYYVSIQNAISASAVQGSILLPDATKELLAGWPYQAQLNDDGTYMKDADGNYVYVDDNSSINPMNSVYAGLSNQVMNMTSLLVKDENRIDFVFEGQSAIAPSSTDGTLIELYIAIPDEATVKTIAEKYGLELVEEDGKYYYEFPVNWNEQGTDEGDSKGTTVYRNRFGYLDASDSDVFAEQVELEDGYIRVEVSKPADTTTTTTAAVTTTTTTEATTVTTTETTTTEEATTTTAEETTTTVATTTEAGTTTTVVTTTTTEDIQVKVVSEVGYYFSVDTRDFNSQNELVNVTVNGEAAAAADVTFRYGETTYATPKDLYDAEGKAYVGVTMDVLYKGEDTDTDVKVYIGVKGDTNLSGKNSEATDAQITLMYNSQNMAGAANVQFLTNSELQGYYTAEQKSDPYLEGLLYFLADIDTEGKNGGNGNYKDGDTSYEISTNDAQWNLIYYSDKMAAGTKTWKEVCPSLTPNSPLYNQ